MTTCPARAQGKNIHPRIANNNTHTYIVVFVRLDESSMHVGGAVPPTKAPQEDRPDEPHHGDQHGELPVVRLVQDYLSGKGEQQMNNYIRWKSANIKKVKGSSNVGNTRRRRSKAGNDTCTRALFGAAQEQGQRARTHPGDD